ncbi:UDP-N-acetylenolpyruvoylglucosamine reductase [Saccharospirillum sp. MSK14-1]|uniref:UDP-N-acetylmuramate dehydrogenase n=1 Tax=Saccharospirillum sp. MSK14-1 TaxID=1897632 RepID=UPI000D47F332|nr:UDP-N-acetylmuramate dehydrogenase [Saccharospirillum sp. MSK14-1]PTY36640.1 UDP-N-acetylenolpyruvoylglucosamine reductase [Saccharospirillum sp. MSK14-1]
MTPQFDADLLPLNTLGIPSQADALAEIETAEQIPAWVDWAIQRELPIRVLGGGSNLLLDARVDGLVIAMRTQGREVVGQDDQGRTLWRLSAGENWHQCVVASIDAGLNGLENLALIPGSVGAAPIQNIGAYGVEVGDLLHELEAYDCQARQWVRFNAEQCELGYRDSRFKREENRYIVTAVTLALSSDFRPQLSYGPLQALADQDQLNARQVMEAVIAQRQSKLPDPQFIPNAGSFFKNPEVDQSVVNTLKSQWPELVAFPSGDRWKLAAGWMIDQCGLKGQANAAGVGCYAKQALVLVNPDHAEYQQVADWQQRVQQAVVDRFGVLLEREPRYWGPQGSGHY